MHARKKHIRHADLMSNKDIIGKASTMILMGKTLDPHQKKKRPKQEILDPNKKKMTNAKYFGPTQKSHEK